MIPLWFPKAKPLVEREVKPRGNNEKLCFASLGTTFVGAAHTRLGLCPKAPQGT